MEFVLAQDFPVGLYACDAPTAVEALGRGLILRSRVLVDPGQVKPAVGIEFVWRNQMEPLWVNFGRIAKLFHMARQQEVKRFYPIFSPCGG